MRWSLKMVLFIVVEDVCAQFISALDHGRVLEL